MYKAVLLLLLLLFHLMSFLPDCLEQSWSYGALGFKAEQGLAAKRRVVKWTVKNKQRAFSRPAASSRKAVASAVPDPQLSVTALIVKNVSRWTSFISAALFVKCQVHIGLSSDSAVSASSPCTCTVVCVFICNILCFFVLSRWRSSGESSAKPRLCVLWQNPRHRHYGNGKRDKTSLMKGMPATVLMDGSAKSLIRGSWWSGETWNKKKMTDNLWDCAHTDEYVILKTKVSAQSK